MALISPNKGVIFVFVSLTLIKGKPVCFVCIYVVDTHNANNYDAHSFINQFFPIDFHIGYNFYLSGIGAFKFFDCSFKMRNRLQQVSQREGIDRPSDPHSTDQLFQVVHGFLAKRSYTLFHTKLLTSIKYVIGSWFHCLLDCYCMTRSINFWEFSIILDSNQTIFRWHFHSGPCQYLIFCFWSTRWSR